MLEKWDNVGVSPEELKLVEKSPEEIKKEVEERKAFNPDTMVSSHPSHSLNSGDFDKNDVLSMRAKAIDLLMYESNGIWQRFNFFTAVHLALFAATFLALQRSDIQGALVAIFLSVSGIGLAFRNLKALKRLWQWHNEWHTEVGRLETLLPRDYAKPFLYQKKVVPLGEHNQPTETVEKLSSPFSRFLNLPLRLLVAQLNVVRRKKSVDDYGGSEDKYKGAKDKEHENSLKWFDDTATDKFFGWFIAVWLWVALYSLAALFYLVILQFTFIWSGA